MFTVFPRFYRSALYLLLCVIAAPASATDMAEVYADALENDPVLGAAVATFDARRELVPQARSGLLPNITISGSSDWNERSFPIGPIQDTNPSSPTFGQFFTIPDQNFNSHSWQTRLNQPIVNLNNWFQWRSAKSTVKAAEAVLDGTDQALIVRVIEAYLNVLRAQDLLDATLAQEKAVATQLEQVQQRFDVGLVAITDVLEATAAHDDSVVLRIQADGDQQIFFETLATLSGIPYTSLDRLSLNFPIVLPEPMNEEEWVTTALATNFNILAAHSQLEAAKRTLAARRSGHLPTIDASVSRSHFVTGGSNFLGGKTDQTTYSIGISVPIYQGGFTNSQAKEARALAEQARQDLLNQQLTVTRDTRNLFQAVSTDVVRVAARDKAITSSQSALEATETGYEVGTRNVVDVLLAIQRLISSQFDYADSRYNYVINLMLLKQTSGGLIDEDLMELNQFLDPNDTVERVASLRNRSANLRPQ